MLRRSLSALESLSHAPWLPRLSGLLTRIALCLFLLSFSALLLGELQLYRIFLLSAGTTYFGNIFLITLRDLGILHLCRDLKSAQDLSTTLVSLAAIGSLLGLACTPSGISFSGTLMIFFAQFIGYAYAPWVVEKLMIRFYVNRVIAESLRFSTASVSARGYTEALREQPGYYWVKLRVYGDKLDYEAVRSVIRSVPEFLDHRLLSSEEILISIEAADQDEAMSEVLNTLSSRAPGIRVDALPPSPIH